VFETPALMQFPHTMGIQNQPKKDIIAICLERRSGTILLKETYFPLYGSLNYDVDEAVVASSI